MGKRKQEIASKIFQPCMVLKKRDYIEVYSIKEK